MKMLFFGRKKDAATQRCIKHLIGLGCEVDVILSSSRDEKLPSDLGRIKHDYIMSYNSYFILPKSLLESTKYFNINFHPGPPKHPGSGGVNLALLNGDEEFGVTAHLMDESVDAGPIIECRNFMIRDSDNLESLLERTHDFLFCLFIELSTTINEKGNICIEERIKNQSVRWSGKKTKISEINKLRVVDPDISESDMANRIRSLNHPSFPLEVHIHNNKFIYNGKI